MSYKFIKVVKLPKGDKKKFKAIFENTKTKREKTIKFGAGGMSDYTIHKDKQRQKRYIARHSKMNEDWNDPLTAGFWSRWMLWSSPNLKDALKLTIGKVRALGF
jgi:hypothetical protein